MDTLLIVSIAFLAGGILTTGGLYSALKLRLEAEFEERFRTQKQQIADEALKRSSATIKGQIGERFAPFLPGFGYEPGDARFLGSPVDYVVFDGMSDGDIKGLAFVEVKSGDAWLTPFQKQIQDLLAGSRVKWRVLRLDQ